MHGVTCVDRAWDRKRELQQARGPALNERRRVNTVKAAEIAGVTKRTIYNWVRAGKVDYVRTANAGVRIYVDSLLRAPKA